MNSWILHVRFAGPIFLESRPLWMNLPYSPNFLSHSSPTETLCSTDGFLTAQEITRLHCCCLAFTHTLLPTWNAVFFLFCLPSFSFCALRSHALLCQHTLTTPFCEFQLPFWLVLCRLALHCVLLDTVLHCLLWAGPVSVEDQIPVPFMMLTYMRGPINTSYIDLEVSTGIDIAKWSVKTLLGGYFRHGGLSLGLKLPKIWQLGWFPCTLVSSPFTCTANLLSNIAATGSLSGTPPTCSEDPRAWTNQLWGTDPS